MLEDEWRPSKLQHYWERAEYWEEFWRLEETCCHSNFSEKLSADTDVKNSQIIIMMIIIKKSGILGQKTWLNNNQQKKRELEK